MKDLLAIKDLSQEQIYELLKLASKMKKQGTKYRCPLIGKTLGMIFQKPSLRTRVSFEVGFYQLGGSSVYLAPDDVKLGKREAVKDFAKVLSRYVHGVVFRSFSHDDIVQFAQHATIPVINGLSDLLHPCQGLSDLLTIWERNKDLKDVQVTYVGDGNNVLHSLMYMASKMGIVLRYSTPKGYEPNKTIVQESKEFALKTNAKIIYEQDPQKAVQDVDFIYADVWTSMGQESEHEKRLKVFKNYQINKKLLSNAKDTCCIMHCLPAHRGEEITDEVLDSSQSVVYDQAENRMHMQKAIMLTLMGKPLA